MRLRYENYDGLMASFIYDNFIYLDIGFCVYTIWQQTYWKGSSFMNRSEMIAILAERVGFSRKDIERVLDEMNRITMDTLASGEKVAFSGFGSFEVRTRAAHTGRDPRTGEQIEVAETRTVAFRPGKVLKSAITK